MRAAGASRTFHGAIFGAAPTLQKGNLSRELPGGGFVPFLRSSSESVARSRAEENLLRLIESRIQFAEETDYQSIEHSGEFSFAIEDNPGERTILLTRKFGDEIIKVEVDMPNISDYEDDDDIMDDFHYCSIPPVVSIPKGKGVQLEFCVTAFHDEITIDSLSIKRPDDSEEGLLHEGPEFNDLDGNIHSAFYDYLDIRGIQPSLSLFLYLYVIDKDSKEYGNWLKNLKDFVEHQTTQSCCIW